MKRFIITMALILLMTNMALASHPQDKNWDGIAHIYMVPPPLPQLLAEELQRTAKQNKIKLKKLRQLVEQGDSNAQEKLGIAYLYGDKELIIEQNFKLAIKLLRKSASQNNSVAAFTMGVVYELGWFGTPRNFKLAIQWFTKAAELGHVYAPRKLGNFYYSTIGLGDYKLAYMWLSIFVASGNEWSGYKENLKLLNILEDSMSILDIFAAQKLAGEWIKKYKD